MMKIPVTIKYMCLSALFFAMMGGCVKEAHLRGIPFLEILAARAFISVCLSYVNIRRKKISPWGNKKLLLLARGATGTIALMCVFYAVTTLPLAEATLLQYLYPIFTSVLAFIFLGEKIGKSIMVSIILSMVGLFTIMQADFLQGALLPESAPLATMGVVAAIIGSLGTSVAYVLVRQLSKTEDPSVIIFYFPFVALPVSCFFLGGGIVIPSDGTTWVLLLAVGIFTQIAQLFITMAIKCEQTATVTAFSYVQVIFATIIGWLFFNEIPCLNTFVGALFILSGALITLFVTKRDTA